MNAFTEIIEDIERKAAESIRPEAGDYTENGLLYCGKCRTPKQVRITVFGEVHTPYCLCKCEKEKQAAEEKAAEVSKTREAIQDLRTMGFPDAEMARWTFERDDGTNPVTQTARRYVANFGRMMASGKGLLLFGSVGTGKTFAAACIANALIDQGYPCLVTNFARLTNVISGMYEGKQEYFDGLSRFKLLVIDDLAAERDTEYMGEIVQNIIDARYRSGLPLIVTTNLTAEEIKYPAEMRKQRIYSRLFEMCIPVEVTGKDRRKEKLKAEHAEYAALLGL